MNSPVKVVREKDKKIEEYEELLVRRDQLFKEAGSILTAYTKEFGDLITANFELKVDCIKKKKVIAYCQKMINKGLSIDADVMHEEIENEMFLYYRELQEMVWKNKQAKDAKQIDEYSLSRSKKIYRRLAKLLHPDINKKTMETDSLRDLWVRIAEAYKKSDVDALEDLEALVNKELEGLGESGFEIAYPDIEDRIERVEAQINEIMTTEPYTYTDLLSDKEKKAAFMEKLRTEHDEYEKYLEELTSILDDMMHDEGMNLIWKML